MPVQTLSILWITVVMVFMLGFATWITWTNPISSNEDEKEVVVLYKTAVASSAVHSKQDPASISSTTEPIRNVSANIYINCPKWEPRYIVHSKQVRFVGKNCSSDQIPSSIINKDNPYSATIFNPFLSNVSFGSDYLQLRKGDNTIEISFGSKENSISKLIPTSITAIPLSKTATTLSKTTQSTSFIMHLDFQD